MPERPSRNDPPAEDGAHTDFRESMSYGDYLCLDRLLAAQRPLSDSHDEMLFVIIHQATELWMKLVLHELAAARRDVQRDDLQPAFKKLARVSRVQAQLIQSWDVLATMTPADYLAFRHRLGHASGFQSFQYRLIEFLLGAKRPGLLAPHRHAPEIHARLEQALGEPSLYDETLRLLARRGFPIAETRIARDWSEPYRPDPSVTAAWLQVYRDTRRHWDLYELAEELVDLDDWSQQWRFRHAKTVERIIGMKRGTGGTAGAAYLRRAVDGSFFPELWEVRTAL
jgi:tryptophan 2,3-dioxygenase